MGKKVLVAGTFDILHPGHARMLQYAKKLAGNGGELVVVVARDENVKKFKGREPILPEEERAFLVSCLKPVDRAVLGDPRDPLVIIEREKPDIVALGYDQWPDEEWLKSELERRGVRARIVRLPKFGSPHDSSSEIVKQIVKIFCEERRLEGDKAISED